ncbi:hypothetical protein [Deinococcus alpinitundrae]|uniref:hypothetical protein n=1 Tax=Deinococcus alpinitundrae TaxID=468913 RepID=UPI001ED96ECB|nr:hypothetical protein [Deinococcus alpinitundrae]
MKKNLMLLSFIGIVALAACGAQPLIPRADLAAAQHVTDLAPITKATEAAPLMSLFPVQSSVTFSGPVWIEVTAMLAAHSTGRGANYSGAASEGEQHRLSIRSTNCGSDGVTGLTFTLAGQTTPEVLGDQDLILVQLVSGKPVPVTAVVTVHGEQI